MLIHRISASIAKLARIGSARLLGPYSNNTANTVNTVNTEQPARIVLISFPLADGTTNQTAP